jgi:catalase
MKLRSVATALMMFAFATSGVARADDQPLEVQIVDALNKAFGVHPGFRANHAKGIVTEGTFKASSAAALLSKAAIFNGATIPVTVRFSDSTGIPNLPDGAAAANPHGMAIKYHLPDGSETDMVINSLKFFLVATGEEFRDLFLAIAASPPGAPKPTKLDEFAAAHPSVGAASATVATPDSYADEEYYGVDAFIFVNKSGKRQAVRYQAVPNRVVHISPADAAKRAPDFLSTELKQRLKRGPITFHLKVQWRAPAIPHAIRRRPGRTRGASSTSASSPSPVSRRTAAKRRRSCCSCRPRSPTGSKPRTIRSSNCAGPPIRCRSRGAIPNVPIRR